MIADQGLSGFVRGYKFSFTRIQLLCGVIMFLSLLKSITMFFEIVMLR